jgi:hypothetical protein
VISDDEAERRFAELSLQTFGESVTPLVLAELRAGHVERAQKILDRDDRERALRIAPREVQP